MSDEIERHLERLLAALDHAVVVDGAAFQIADHIWAVHGHLTYGGDVILEEFDTLEEAAWVLRQLPVGSAAS